MKKRFSSVLFTLLALLLVAGPVLAATGDPLPGVDILVKKKPSDKKSTVHFGQPDFPGIPADFFGPGSDPFTGDVDLKGMCTVSGCSDCDNDCDGPHSHTDFTEGASPETIEIEMVPLTLRSVDPITVNVNGEPTLFDVRIVLSGDAAATETPFTGQFTMPAGTVLAPGVSTFIVDSFFDVWCSIEFFAAGTNSLVGSVLTVAVHMVLQDIDLPVTRDTEGAQPVVMGYDGTLVQPFLYRSDGGGFDLGLESVYANVVANEDASWGEVKSLFR